ncbi:unnamed protein product [Schistosoma haematobium]|nr:unnamed protein product [Schistosoma haematobium]
MYISEILNWDGKYNSNLKYRNVCMKSLNSPVSDIMRQGIPEKNLCLLFCGGSKCKYCNPSSFFDVTKMHLNGLYSTWITQNILATSRPSETLIKEFDIIEQFKRMSIRSIFNMETAGEHSSCGFGVLSSGFSYDPLSFMKNNIAFYNFSWCDYDVASLQFILDTVTVIQFAIFKGKIAIHCHAGLGRTGVIIACYLVFNNRISAGEAIQYVRFRRPGSIQTQNQVGCVYKFEKYLNPYRIYFGSHGQFSLEAFLKRQNVLLHGPERIRLRNIPKIIYMCCKLLVRIIVTGCTSVQIDSSNHRNRIVSDENNCQSSKRLSTTNVTQSEAFTSCQPDETTELTSTTADYSYGKNSPNQSVDDNQSVGASFVIEALLTTQYPESVVNETEYWKKKFNNDPEAWDDFDKTSFNGLVLVKLIDDWLTHLKPVVCLMSLFAKLITYLQPLSEQMEHLLIERVLNWLCQKQSKSLNITTNTKKFNEQFRCYHTRFGDLFQLAFRIMHFLIEFVKSKCTLIESVNLLSNSLPISQ